MERDLAVFRDHLLEHRTSSLTFIDDCLIVKLCGPRSRSEFDDGIADSTVQLTPFSRECASLWLVLYGCRRGHYNEKGTAAATLKRNSTRGFFRRTALGVLAAARLAADSARRKSGTGCSSGSVVHSGAGTVGSVLWNADMAKFQKRSGRNIPGCLVTRANPGSAFLDPVGVDLSRNRGAILQAPRMLQHNAAVALLGVSEEQLRHPTECRIFTGVHRCEKVDLAVVPDLSILHNVDALAADVELAVSFLYIVSLGVDVATTAQFASVNGVPRLLQPLARVHHLAAIKTNYTFFVGSQLSIEQEDLPRALRCIARVPGSKYVVSDKLSADTGDIVFNSLHDVVAWACSVRRVENSIGPKAFADDGMAMPT